MYNRFVVVFVLTLLFYACDKECSQGITQGSSWTKVGGSECMVDEGIPYTNGGSFKHTLYFISDEKLGIILGCKETTLRYYGTYEVIDNSTVEIDISVAGTPYDGVMELDWNDDCSGFTTNYAYLAGEYED